VSAAMRLVASSRSGGFVHDLLVFFHLNFNKGKRISPRDIIVVCMVRALRAR
jgi:hypothetical protein